MKRTIILVSILALSFACKREDVFATWRDPSKFVIASADEYFTVMQYNIWGYDSPWTPERFDAVANVINNQRPDFVSLNEIDSLTRANPWFQCREIAQRTGMYYAYAVAREPYSFHWNQPGAYGDAVLSRYPIEEIRRFKLFPDLAQGDDEREDRAVCAIKVRVHDRSLWIASTHLDHRGNELSRIYQANQLKPIIQSLDGPVVLCGDLNANPGDETMAIISSYMTPQYPSPSSEYYTYPSRYNGRQAPDQLLDYILLKKDDPTLTCVTYRVVNSPASDHCAVVANFKFND